MRHIAKNISYLFIGLVVVTFITALKWKALEPFSWTGGSGYDYGIVLDAGSHGTRAHLFEWNARIQDPNKPFKKPVTFPVEIHVAESHPGIGAYVESKAPLIKTELIEPLIEQVEEELEKRKVPRTDWSTIPIGLKATAGMRDVAPDVRGAAMAVIRATLKETPFRFKDSDARTISGEEEGMFGWLATNYKTDTLFSAPQKTIGALDMGGASTQIVFKPIHTSIIEDSYEVTLAEEDVRLYSHSYLGYGWGDSLGRVTARMAIEVVLGYLESLKWPQDETEKFTQSTMAQKLVQLVHKTGSESVHLSPRLKKKHEPIVNNEKTITLEADNPCFPKGYDYLYTLPDLAYPEGRMFLDVDRLYMHEYMLSLGLGPVPSSVKVDQNGEVVFGMSPKPETPQFDTSTPHNPLIDAAETRTGGLEAPFTPFDGYYGREMTVYQIHWIGTGEYRKCRERAKSLFYKNPCFTHSCSFNGIYQPRLEGSNFKAFGQYSKVAEAIGVPSNPSLKTFDEKVAEICSEDYSKLEENAKLGHYKGFGKKKVHKLCWKALWSYTFLVDGIKFPIDSQAITFEPSASSDNGWAMGSMIYEVNRLPYKVLIGRFKWPFYSACITILVAFFALRELYHDNVKMNYKLNELTQDSDKYTQHV